MYFTNLRPSLSPSVLSAKLCSESSSSEEENKALYIPVTVCKVLILIIVLNFGSLEGKSPRVL